VRIVTRKRRVQATSEQASSPRQTVVCVYCGRAQCKGCPLKFDDKVTLQQVLDKAGICASPHYLYEENRLPQQPSNQKKAKSPQKSKRRTKKPHKDSKLGSQSNDNDTVEVVESDNFEFEILI